MNILSKSILCILLLLSFVLLLLFMLSFFKFQSVLANLIANRLSATSPAIYESIESAIDLGLNLDEIQNTQHVIARVRQNNPGIQSIIVFNKKGKILYSAGDQVEGQRITPHILDIFAASAEHSAEVESEQNFNSTFKLLNNYDQIIGGGIITYTKD